MQTNTDAPFSPPASAVPPGFLPRSERIGEKFFQLEASLCSQIFRIRPDFSLTSSGFGSFSEWSSLILFDNSKEPNNNSTRLKLTRDKPHLKRKLLPLFTGNFETDAENQRVPTQAAAAFFPHHLHNL